MVSGEVPVVVSMLYYIFSNDLEADLNLLLQKFSSRITGVVNNDEDGALIERLVEAARSNLVNFNPANYKFVYLKNQVWRL